MKTLLLLLLLPLSALADCKVTRIIDGDTFDVRCWGLPVERIRVLGMDAPDSCGPRIMQAYSGEAIDKAKALLLNKSVIVDRSGRFSFGRRLARIIYDDNAGEPQDFARSMIRFGLAYSDLDHPGLSENVKAGYRLMEVEAQKARRAIWSTPGAMSPKTWRVKNCGGRIAKKALGGILVSGGGSGYDMVTHIQWAETSNAAPEKVIPSSLFWALVRLSVCHF